MMKEWVLGEKVSVTQVNRLAKQLNVNTAIANLLISRGILDFEDAKKFFRPSLDHLHDPFLMKDLDKAVNRLSEAIFTQEKILIYGDYDVDGTTAVSMTYLFLQNYSSQLGFYVPDRYTEGYGISEKGVNYAKSQGYTLMIALDCGITANRQADLAKSLGIDLIICDHHLPTEILPDAFAILDPKRKDCNYPFKELSGCGVGFKLLQGLCIQNTLPIKKLYGLFDLLLVSIAADIVPISGENRTMAYFGLQKINQSPLLGVQELISVSGLSSKLNVSNVVFGIAPRINAAGRIGHANEAVKLLISTDPREAKQIAETINSKNTERKDLDKCITDEAIKMLESDQNMEEAKTTVLFKEDWHKGVIGIVASRCIERYYRPTIILTSSGDKVTGSARSVDGFDVHQAISECEEHLEQFGGHKYAAGLTLSEDNIAAFKDKFEEVVSRQIQPQQMIPKLLIDGHLEIPDLTFNFHNVLQQMAPFGPGNKQPVFVSKGLHYQGEPRLLKEAHIKMVVRDPSTGKNIDAIAFGMGDLYGDLLQCTAFDLAYHVDINDYRGKQTLQLMVKDIKLY